MKPMALFFIWIGLFIFYENLTAQPKTTIAVLSLDAHGISGSEADVLTIRLRSLLVNLAKYDVVDRSRMEDIFQEQGFQQTGCTSNECVVEAGKLLGVQKMLAGSIGKFGTVYTLDLRLIDVETGRIESSSSYDYQGAMENLLTAAVETALRQLTGTLDADQLSVDQRRRLFGSLEIRSQPPAAAVILNGRREGLTPLRFNALQAGYHELRLEKEGFLPLEERIMIEANQTSTRNFKLSSQYAYMDLKADYPQAEWLVNDQEVGKGRFIAEKMNPGTYRIEVRHPFFNRYEEEITLTPDDSVFRSVELVPAFGILQLQGEPANATVGIIDERRQDYYAMTQVNNLQLQAGYYDLEIKAPYYYPHRQSITIRGNEQLPLTIDLKFGGNDLAGLRNQRKWLNRFAMAGLGLTAGSMLAANSMYDNYKRANSSADAELYRKRTELFDSITFGLAAVTVGISTYSIWTWVKEKRLRKTLGIN